MIYGIFTLWNYCYSVALSVLFSIYTGNIQMKDINARLERIEPKVRSMDGLKNNFSAVEVRSVGVNPKKSSLKAKSSAREASLFGG